MISVYGTSNLRHNSGKPPVFNITQQFSEHHSYPPCWIALNLRKNPTKPRRLHLFKQKSVETIHDTVLQDGQN